MTQPTALLPAYTIYVSSPSTNFNYDYFFGTPDNSVDEMINHAIQFAQEEVAYYAAKKNFPMASTDEIEEALTHLRLFTQSDHEEVDARQAFDDKFFTVNIDMGSYGILICGVRQD